MCRLRRAALMRVVDDDLRSFVGHVALSFTLEKRMSLVRKIFVDSRTCSGNPADFTARLPEPIRADATLGVVLSLLTFVNNLETVMRDYTNRLYFAVGLGDTDGLVQTKINDRVYMHVIDDAEAGPNDRIFVIPPATDTLETRRCRRLSVWTTRTGRWVTRLRRLPRDHSEPR